MKYLLDTNICIYAMKGAYLSISDKLLKISPENIAISSVTIGELEYGAAKSKWGERTRNIMNSFLSNYQILDFAQEDAICFGKIRALLASNGTPIGAYDIMIGAQGVSRGLIVITHNTKEFSRIPGLRLEDWVQETL